jgi:hypothetical protein
MISIDMLRNRKHVVSQHIHKSDTFKVKQSFTLMTPVPSILPFLSSPKVTYSLCDRGVRLENHFLFLVMCHEQPKSMSHVSSKPPSITYIGREKARWLSAEVSEINHRNPALNYAIRRTLHNF